MIYVHKILKSLCVGTYHLNPAVNAAFSRLPTDRHPFISLHYLTFFVFPVTSFSHVNISGT